MPRQKHPVSLIIATVALAVLALVLLWRATGGGPSATELYDRANRFAADQQYRQAEGLLATAIQLDPSLITARYQRAVLLAQLGRYGEVWDEYRQALGAAPEYATPERLTVFRQLAREWPDFVDRYLDAARRYLQIHTPAEPGTLPPSPGINESPGFYAAVFDLAARLTRLDYLAALEPLERQIRRRFVGAKEREILSALRRADFATARERLRESPGTGRPRPTDGTVDLPPVTRLQTVQAYYEKAWQSFVRAARLDPTFLAPQVALIRLQLARGDQAEAEAGCRRLLSTPASERIPPTARADLELLRADTLSGQGEWEQAEAVARQVLRRRPQHRPARLFLARLALAHRDPDAAWRELTGVPEDSEDLEARYVRAVVDLTRGRPQAAATALHAIVLQRPRWGQAHFNLGLALHHVGQPYRASAELQAAARYLPSGRRARLASAAVSLAGGRHEQAESESLPLLEQPGFDRDALVIHLLALVGQGKLETARPFVERLLTRAPDSRLGYLCLAGIELAAGRPVPTQVKGPAGRARLRPPPKTAAVVQIFADLVRGQLAAGAERAGELVASLGPRRVEDVERTGTELAARLVQARVQWLLGDRDEALDTYRRLAAAYPNYPILRLALAMSAYAEDRWLDAYSQFEASTRCGPSSPIWLPLGDFGLLRDVYLAARGREEAAEKRAAADPAAELGAFAARTLRLDPAGSLPFLLLVAATEVQERPDQQLPALLQAPGGAELRIRLASARAAYRVETLASLRRALRRHVDGLSILWEVLP